MTAKAYTFTIDGMHCTSCGLLIREALEDEGATVSAVRIDEKKNVGVVTVTSSLPEKKLRALITAQGAYTVR